MNIEKLNNYAVKIVLSESDLDIYDTNFRKMDSRSTAELVFSLTDEIMMCSGIDISDKKLIAEVFPHLHGCIIFLSFDPEYGKTKYNKIILTVNIENYGRIKSFCRFLQGAPEYRTRSSSLYFDGEQLCLVILCDERSSGTIYRAAECYGYAEYADEMSEMFLSEHFLCVENGSAVDKAAI